MTEYVSMALARPGRFALADADRETGLSSAVINGEVAGARLPGLALEAAVALGDGGWLVFVTDDVPFEEWLRILLLSPQGAPEDWLTIGLPMSGGTFRDLEILDGAAARFWFMGGAPWTVRVLARPRLRLPLPVTWNGVWRPMRLFGRLEISGRPRPGRG